MGSRQIVSGSIGGNYMIITCLIVLRFILSMWTEHNKPSHQTRDHPFTLACQRLRPFTRPGNHKLRRTSILSLSNAAAKIAEYYDKMATSDAFVFSMCGLCLS